jgi:hypothetical protein
MLLLPPTESSRTLDRMAQHNLTQSQQGASGIEAAYSSPTGQESFRHVLPVLEAQHSTEEKTNYLAAIRNKIPLLQEQINQFLTQKMEEDKSKGAKPISNRKHGSADESKEEENYGEEVIDES